MTDNTLKRLESLQATITLLEINGEADGWAGYTKEEGWDDLCSGVPDDFFELPSSHHAFQTFYENGWQKGHDKRVQKAKESLLAQGWPDNNDTLSTAWEIAAPISEVEIMDGEDVIHKNAIQAERDRLNNIVADLKSKGGSGKLNVLEE